MLCIQPSWMPFRHESKLHKTRSIDSFFATEDESSTDENESMSYELDKRERERFRRRNSAFLLKETGNTVRSSQKIRSKSRRKRSSVEKNSVPEEKSIQNCTCDLSFDNPHWEQHSPMEQDYDFETFGRKGSVGSTTSSSSRKSSHKLKNIIDWVQRSGRRASLKYKSLKRKGSLPEETESKIRCEELSRKSLLDVLQDKESTRKFREFLLKEMSEENLDFWIDIENYKKQKASKQEKLAPAIFDTFIASSSVSELNLDAQVRRLTLEKLQHPDSSTFDLAQNQIYKLMENDSYRRFCLQTNSF